MTQLESVDLDVLRSFRFIEQLSPVKDGHANAVIYKAERRDRPGMFVAIKQYCTRTSATDEKVLGVVYRARLLYEVGRLFDHPSVVRTRALLDNVFVVLDWVPGISIANLIRGEPIPTHEAFRIIIEMADGLAHITEMLNERYPDAPELGHGDLHFDNVLVVETTAGRRPVIVDIDHIGRAIRGDGQLGPEMRRQVVAAGRFICQSPEYVLGTVNYADSCADVFSLGVHLFWLLFGDSPYGDDLGFLQHLESWCGGDSDALDIPLPPFVDAQTGKGIQRVLRRMLRFDRTQRYCRIADVRSDLCQVAARLADETATMAEPTARVRSEERRA